MFLLCNKGLVVFLFFLESCPGLLRVDFLPKIARRQPCHPFDTQVALEINKEKHKSWTASYGSDPKEMFKPCGNQQQKMKDDQLTWPEGVFAYINLGTLHEM